MKNIFLIATLIISSWSFAQDSGRISGNVLDLESSKEPLLFAKIIIKENGAETLTDENGQFKFENIPAGTYTLTYSFVGYETQEIETKVIDGQTTDLALYLQASTISLEELMLTIASADKKESTISNN